LVGETEVFRRKPHPVHFVHQKSHMIYPGLEPEPPPELWHGIQGLRKSVPDFTLKANFTYRSQYLSHK
jgi:hypothetical protein